MVEFLTPIGKAWSTEVGTSLVSEALQVFGGMGFIEETGVAQYYRDVRIAQIYEGTTGIQANDLLGRKFLKDMGKTATKLIGRMQATAKELAESDNAEVKAIAAELAKSVQTLSETSMWLGNLGAQILGGKADVRTAFAGAVPYLMLWGTTLGGWLMARSAEIAAHKSSDEFYAAKLVTARYYADHVLPRVAAYKNEITAGAGSTLGLSESQFSADRASLALV